MTSARAQPEAIDIPADDSVIIFRTQTSGIRGRLVRLGAAADDILAPHAAPSIVSEALGEALVLATLTGSVLKSEGQVIFQTRTSGAISFLVADYQAPGQLRGYARFDAQALAIAGETLDPVRALGEGHLAMTMSEGPARERYQGVMALDGVPLSSATAEYFEQRESLPTFVRAAVAQHYSALGQDAQSTWRWRAGGIMIQSLELGRDDAGAAAEDWARVRMLASTIEDHELLDPQLPSARLLLRLFHEEGVIVERTVSLQAKCRCSRERISSVLMSFGAKELADMQDALGQVSVTCEFCTAVYAFHLSEIGEPLREPGPC
jgi:molecular chaperone Hsp33